jgi:DNA repair exonuclease SbcCD ATPase subunit
MAEVTDEELENKRQHVAELRDQLAEAEMTRTARVRETDNTIEAAQLDAEAARLEAQLEEAKAAADVGVVEQGASGPLAQAKAKLQQVERQTEARRESEEARKAQAEQQDTPEESDKPTVTTTSPTGEQVEAPASTTTTTENKE